jgi:PadR family transcriptional regulator, regulatory protein PadR
MPNGRKTGAKPQQGKRERYIQPSILLGLYLKPSYGYELIQNIQKFGFVQGQAPPGMIYRHLHQLEEYGWVSSEWKTEGTGPAKRMYQLTEEGKQMLAVWVDYMERQARVLSSFVSEYHKTRAEDEPEAPTGH